MDRKASDIHVQPVTIPQNPGLSSQVENMSEGNTTPTSPTDSITLPPLNFLIPETPERTRIRLASAFVMFFVLGWGDGVTGALLPYFKTDFRLTFMTSSLCFVASAVGFGCGTLVVERLLNVAGRIYIRSGKVTLSVMVRVLKQSQTSDTLHIMGHSPSLARYIVVFGSTLLHPIFFVIMGCRRNFPSMLVAYVISAFARSLLSATMNFYCASTSKKALGYMYGYWAVGSMFAPLVCQSIVAHGVAWNHFYFGSLVLSAICSVLAFFAFQPTVREIERDGATTPLNKCNKQTKVHKCSELGIPSVDEANLAELKRSTAGAPDTHCAYALGRALRVPMVWAFAVFAGLYTGDEASTQGFIVTYLLNVRNANPGVVGYTTTGFWGGLALSRFVWGHFNTQLSFRQRKHAIHLCIGQCLFSELRNMAYGSAGLALSMHLLIWFIDSFVGNVLSTAVVGLAYGPIFPGSMGQANEVLPKELRMIAMSVIGAFGSCGAALFPFLTGMLSNLEGPQTFTYVVACLTTSMLCMWCFLPSSVPVRTPSP